MNFEAIQKLADNTKVYNQTIRLKKKLKHPRNIKGFNNHNLSYTTLKHRTL